MQLRTCGIGSLILGACSSRATTPHKPLANANVATTVRIAVAAYDSVSLVDVMPGGSQVVRSAKVASRIDTLDWLSDDPIVLLQRGSLYNCGIPEEAYPDHAAWEAANRDCDTEARHDGTIGRLTATGFVAYPALPASTWDLLQQPKDATQCETSCWSLDVKGVEVWQGHCKWVFSADGTDHCHDWAYARLDVPGPAAMRLPNASPAPTALDDVQPAQPTIAAPANVTVHFDAVTPPSRFNSDEPEAHLQLTCAIGDTEPTLYPSKLEDLDGGMSRELTWLATDPPIFAAWHRHDGFEMTEELVVFERCKRTGYEHLVFGPGGLVALVGPQRIEVRRSGVLVGSTDGGNLVSFAPARPPSR